MKRITLIFICLLNFYLTSFSQQPTVQIIGRNSHFFNIVIQPITLRKDQIKIIIDGRSLKIINRSADSDDADRIITEEVLPAYIAEGAEANLADNTLLINNLLKSDTPQQFEIPIVDDNG